MSVGALPTSIGYYLDHVSNGIPMRTIAGRTGRAASVVCRGVRRAEDLREIPEWDEIIGRLEKRQRDRNAGEITATGVMDALGVRRDELLAAFIAPGAPVADPAAEVVTAAKLEFAVVMVGGEAVGRIPRRVALGAIALGWLRCTSPNGARARSFVPVRSMVDETLRPPAARRAAPGPQAAPGLAGSSAAELAVVRLHRQYPHLVDNRLRDAGQAFADMWAFRDGPTRASYDALRAAVPPRLLTVLEQICGERMGVEVMEKSMGLPARSGKVLIAAALEAASHSGVLP